MDYVAIAVTINTVLLTYTLYMIKWEYSRLRLSEIAQKVIQNRYYRAMLQAHGFTDEEIDKALKGE